MRARKKLDDDILDGMEVVTSEPTVSLFADAEMYGGPSPSLLAASSELPSGAPRGRSSRRKLSDFDDGQGETVEQDNSQKAEARPAPQEPEAVSMTGYVSRIIFSNDETNYRVIALSQRPNSPPTDTVSINMQRFSPKPGDRVSFVGVWGEYKGRRQLVATSASVLVKRDLEGVGRWLREEAQGVGPVTAKLLLHHFGDEIVAVIDDATALQEAGISARKATSIVDAWTANQYHNELMVEVMGYGLDLRASRNIVETYGAGIRHIMQTSPWTIAEVSGVSFTTADAIALRKGFSKQAPERILAGLAYVHQEAMNRGHCGLPSEKLTERTASILRLRTPDVSAQMEALLGNGRHLEANGLIYDADTFESEQWVAARLAEIMMLPDRMTVEEAQERADIEARKIGIELHPGQMEAVVTALVKPLCVITGGPGTGKSTVQKVVVNALRKSKYTLSLGCPTGKGAKRLSEASGEEASTIHRQLGFNPAAEPGEEFHFNAENPREEDIFINDEQSMLPLNLQLSQLKALKPGGSMLMVGDVRQLPSVGAGQVLRDVIESGVVPVARLSQPFRTARDSGIATAAHRIDQGEMPSGPDDAPMRGFEFIEADDNNIMNVVSRLVTTILPKKGFVTAEDVAVLSSVKEGPYGVKRMNKVLKHLANPSWGDDDSKDFGGETYTQGDVVMRLSNCYLRDVRNGDIGRVDHFGMAPPPKKVEPEEAMFIRFEGRELAFAGEKDLAQLALAYAGTPHKWQGSEQKVVIMLVPQSQSFVLTRACVYTGLTRAKTQAYIVGSSQALSDALRRTKADRRFTGLAQEIRSQYALLTGHTYDEPVAAREDIKSEPRARLTFR